MRFLSMRNFCSLPPLSPSPTRYTYTYTHIHIYTTCSFTTKVRFHLLVLFFGRVTSWNLSLSLSLLGLFCCKLFDGRAGNKKKTRCVLNTKHSSATSRHSRRTVTYSFAMGSAGTKERTQGQTRRRTRMCNSTRTTSYVFERRSIPRTSCYTCATLKVSKDFNF